jgi:hypothetical protein
MQAGVLVSEASPERRLDVYFSWHPGKAASSVLDVLLPRGSVVSRGDYMLHSPFLPMPLSTHFNGSDWAVRSGRPGPRNGA